jgi:hypothetical protein
MIETGVFEEDRVEGLLHLLCEELFDAVDEVRTLACQSIDHEAGMTVPLQYLLCILDLPQARRALLEAAPAWRAALERLEALVLHADAVWAEDRRGWANLEALLHAPWPVRRPSQPDLRDWDVLLALERDGRFGGSWDAQLEWLHQQGSRENQPDIQRILQLAAFERAYGASVQAVLSEKVQQVAGG